MSKHVFQCICTVLRQQQLLRNTRRLSVEAQLMLFLRFCGHAVTNRELQERFAMSGQTVSATLRRVQQALCALAPSVITQTGVAYNSTRISGPKHHFFQDAVGALDGTHIPVIVPGEDQQRYRNRKGTQSQNVLAACNFELNFTYVLPGWEGQANDQAVLNDAVANKGFQCPPGRHYLADGGYTNKHGCLIPYRATRYHLREFARGQDGYGIIFCNSMGVWHCSYN
jgi:hypothetical protein